MSKELVFPERGDKREGYQSAGIQIQYIKNRDVLLISGFYDGCVGIGGTEISVKDFCDRLGINLKKNRV